MSNLGHKPTYAVQNGMSALPQIATTKADIEPKARGPLWPKADFSDNYLILIIPLGCRALALLFWQLVIRNFKEPPYTRIPRARILPRIAMPMDLIEYEQTYR